jgi:hypothetical protein
MKRNFLIATVALGLLVPLAAFAGQAGAANPHGSKGDPNGSCSGSGGSGGAGGCTNSPLPQSEGCLHGNAPTQNPHCITTQTTTTATTPVTPVVSPQGKVSGNQNAAGGNAGVAAAASELPFTGIDATLLALMGGLLLTAGLGLRRLSRREPAMAMFVAGPAGRGDESLPFRPFMG